MPGKRKIRVEIEEDGSVKIDAIGFEGKACEDFTKELEKVLGEEVSEQKKPEWYQQKKVVVQH